MGCSACAAQAGRGQKAAGNAAGLDARRIQARADPVVQAGGHPSEHPKVEVAHCGDGPRAPRARAQLVVRAGGARGVRCASGRRRVRARPASGWH